MKRFPRSDVQRAIQLAAYYLGRLNEYMPGCRTYYLDAMDDGTVDLEIPCKSKHMLHRVRNVLEMGPSHRKGDEWYRKLGALTLSAYIEQKGADDE